MNREQFRVRAGILGVTFAILVTSVAAAAGSGYGTGPAAAYAQEVEAMTQIEIEREAYRESERQEAEALRQSILDYQAEYEQAQIDAWNEARESGELLKLEVIEEVPSYYNPDSLIKSRDWGAEDAEILLQIAMAEAEGEGVEGKALVMCVVLNRVWSEGFPDSIEAVVFQKGQFSVTQPGGRYYTTTPDAECSEALEMVMHGWDESQGALFFEAYYNTSSWHRENLQRLFQYGDHIFYTTKTERTT